MLEKDFPESCLVWLLLLVEVLYCVAQVAVLENLPRFSVSRVCGERATRSFTTCAALDVAPWSSPPSPFLFRLKWRRVRYLLCEIWLLAVTRYYNLL